MKKLMWLLSLGFLLVASAASANDAANGAPSQPRPGEVVEAKYVCMVNNQVFPKAQIPVDVGGKTYYGCCAMCKDRLAQDQEARTAIDPLTGEKVDKATAYIVVADQDLNVYYFKNKTNADAFLAKKKG